MRKLFPDLKVEQGQVTDILANEVLKREVIEGDKVKEIQQKIKRAATKLAKAVEKKAVISYEKKDAAIAIAIE